MPSYHGRQIRSAGLRMFSRSCLARIVGKQEVIRFLPVCSSTDHNRGLDPVESPGCDLRGVIQSARGNRLQFKSVTCPVRPECSVCAASLYVWFTCILKALSAFVGGFVSGTLAGDSFSQCSPAMEGGAIAHRPALHDSRSFRGCSWLVLWSCSDSCRVDPILSWRPER